jgi:hypothetical protein
MTVLPNELLLKIVSDPSLSYFDLLRVRAASRSFRELAACVPRAFATRPASSHKPTKVDIAAIAIHPMLSWVKWIGLDPDTIGNEQPELLLGFGGADQRRFRLSACAAASEKATSPSGPNLTIVLRGRDDSSQERRSAPVWLVRVGTGVTVADVLRHFWKALEHRALAHVTTDSRLDISDLMYCLEISAGDDRRVALRLSLSTFLTVCRISARIEATSLM